MMAHMQTNENFHNNKICSCNKLYIEIRGGINTVISLKYILNNDDVVGSVFERLHISGKDTMKYYYTLK